MAKSNYTPIDKIIRSAKKGEMDFVVSDSETASRKTSLRQRPLPPRGSPRT